MMYKIKIIILTIVSVMLLCAFNTNAKTHDWTDLTQQQYIDALVECKITLDELKWSYNLWPKANKTAKPLFADVVDVAQIRQSVEKTLKMQAVLADRFNFEITPAMLQHDLDRMASNTKDAKRLKKLFAVLNNDATTITQCVSRPYLVQKKLANQYNYNNQIHAQVKLTAQTELDKYLQSNNTEGKTAQVHTVTYTIKSDEEKNLTDEIATGPNQEIVIELDVKEYKQKLKQLNNKNLQEQKTAFFYNEILEQTQHSIKVQVLQWQKQSQNTWFSIQTDSKYLPTPQTSNYSLAKITGLTKSFNKAAADTWETESYDLDDRYNHNAIWSGSEVIIWGGYNGSYLSSGGRYDPVADSLVATSTTGAPTGRMWNTAIWTGSEMIIWGGSASPSPINTGGRYNPVADSWAATSVGSNVPSSRRFHTAIWSGSEMIIWGGSYNSNGYLNTGGRYDPVADSWVATSVGSNVPSGRRHHTAIWSGSEVIIWGGYTGEGGINRRVLNTGGRYDPVADSWVATSVGNNVPSSRQHFTAIWTGTEMIIWGGYDWIGGQIGGGSLNTGGRYDPVADSWVATSVGSNVPSIRFYHTAIWSGSEMIIWGGFNGSYYNTGGRYDPVADSWVATSTTGAPAGRVSHTAIWTGSEMVVWAGFLADATPTNSMGIYYANNYYDIGGNLSGLNGDQVIIQNVAGDDLTLTANGAFTFDSKLVEGSGYEVTVLTDPTNPEQTCTVTNGIGINLAEDISNVAINCINNTYNVGINLTGLAAGNSVMLLNNGGDLLDVSSNNVTTNFSTAINAGASYTITFDTQPTTPKQTCSIAPGAETGTSTTGVDVVVDVVCVTDQFTVDVSVNGLDASHSIEVKTNGQTLNFTGDGSSSFNPIDDGTYYAVILTAQPSSPNQVCGITGGTNNDGSGTLSGENVAITIICVTTQYSLDVTVTGLEVSNSIELTTNSQSLNFNNDGFASFNPINDATPYAVLLTAQPTNPVQVCSITGGNGGNNGGQGAFIGANVPISVNCTINQYFVGGMASGLASGNSVVIAQGAENLILNDNTAFVFLNPLTNASNYTVSVIIEPTTPNQTCDLVGSTGTITGNDITDVEVNCLINSYLIGGNVSGLLSGNSLILRNNGTDDLTISSEGIFDFVTAIDDLQSYDVTIQNQPNNPIQPCTVSNGNLLVAGADVTTVEIVCEFGDDLIYLNGFE